MKKKRKWGLLALFLGMVLLGVFTIYSIVKIQAYGQLINYTGIVRGATQRLIKLELQGMPNDELMNYLDDILDNLNTGHGNYGLILPDDKDYQEKLQSLTAAWSNLREVCIQTRTNPQNAPELLEKSETYFNLANETVFSAQYFSHRQTMMLMVMIICLFLCLLLAWVLIFVKDANHIVRLEKSNLVLADQAGRDVLTGAYTLEHFKEAARYLLEHVKDQLYVVLYVDFEEFKYINDVFGYDYGDSILLHYAQIIQDSLRKNEIAGRVNADNFVILRQYNSKDEILPRQRAVDEKINDFVRNSDVKCSISVCCGICCIEDLIENLQIEGILDRANFARKTVKQGKHKNYAFYDESIRKRLLQENLVRSDLETAFSNQEFQIYYQPKILLSDNRIAGAEALARWKKPDGTLIPPDVFIPVLEKDKNIAALDQYIMEGVCQWLQKRIQSGKKPLPVSVNVSRLQFYNPEFVKTYVRIRDSYHIPVHLLEIEFTETIAFENTHLMIETVKALKAAGFPCSMDDFGKGYSSLGLLKNLPIDTLKMDKDFFDDLDSDAKEKQLVKGIIDIMRKLCVNVVAEGIERDTQVEFLRQCHCTMIQGYFFYKPLQQDDYETLLDSL